MNTRALTLIACSILTIPACTQTETPQATKSSVKLSENLINLSEYVTRSNTNGSDAFKSIIQNNDVVIVDFYADWCGPCKALAKDLPSIAKTNPHIVFLKVNVDEHKTIAAGIRSIPTLMLYQDGQKIETVVGANIKGLINKTK